MIFFFKAYLMMILPFYRVDLPNTDLPSKVTYQVHVNGQTMSQLLLDKKQIEVLKKVLIDEMDGWKYDLTSYVPSRTYVGYDLNINIVGNLVVVQDKEYGQLSKEFKASNLNLLNEEVEKYRDIVKFKISKEGKYKVSWISFDTSFFTPTDYTNFESRIERRFRADSKFLDNMFKHIEKACLKWLDEYEPRVLIESPEGLELIITQDKEFITLKKSCNYSAKEVDGAINDIEKAMFLSIRKKAEDNPVPQYAPIFN